jgi:hypothetical protein
MLNVRIYFFKVKLIKSLSDLGPKDTDHLKKKKEKRQHSSLRLKKSESVCVCEVFESDL